MHFSVWKTSAPPHPSPKPTQYLRAPCPSKQECQPFSFRLSLPRTWLPPFPSTGHFPRRAGAGYAVASTEGPSQWAISQIQLDSQQFSWNIAGSPTRFQARPLDYSLTPPELDSRPPFLASSDFSGQTADSRQQTIDLRRAFFLQIQNPQKLGIWRRLFAPTARFNTVSSPSYQLA